VGLCLWVLLGPLHIGQPAGYPLPELARDRYPEPIPAPADTPEPVPIPASSPERKLDLGMAGVPGDRSPLVTQVQSALIKKGHWVTREYSSLQVRELLPRSRDGLGGYDGFGNLPRRMGAPARHSTSTALQIRF
jgi:hypothetical protein